MEYPEFVEINGIQKPIKRPIVFKKFTRKNGSIGYQHPISGYEVGCKIENDTLVSTSSLKLLRGLEIKKSTKNKFNKQLKKFRLQHPDEY